MNIAKQFVNISSEWFNKENKQRKFLKIGIEGLYLYLNLFRYCLSGQDNPYTFITSIGLLRKDIGYTTEEIVELIKLLKSNKIIKITNLSRWDYILDKDGKVDTNRLLIIEAIDYPIESAKFQANDETEHWVTVDLKLLFGYYPNHDLDKRYYPIYCLMRMLASGHTEKKSYMTIENMAEVLGYNKNTLNKLIHKMNEAEILHSIKKTNNKNGMMMEHFLCFGMKEMKAFHAAYYPKKRLKNK